MKQDPITDLSRRGNHLKATDPHVLRVYYGLMDTYVPASVLVDHTWSILHIFGDATQFLHLPTGPFSGKLLSMIPESWSAKLRSMIADFNEQQASDSRSPKYVKFVHKTNFIWVTIQAVGEEDSIPFFHIIFSKKSPTKESPVYSKISSFQSEPNDVEIAAMKGFDTNEMLSLKHAIAPSFGKGCNGEITTFEHVEKGIDAVIIEDLEGKILKWNQAASLLFGYSWDEVKEQDSAIILPSRKTAELNAIRVLAKTGLHITNVETERVKKDGRIVDVAISVTPLLSEHGKVTQILFIVRDISETKLIAQKLVETANLETQKMMAGGIAHQFNNLLTGVMVNASYIKSQYGNESDLIEPLSEIEDAARKSSELCSKMLSYARNVSYVRERINFKQLVVEVIQTVKQTFKENISLQFEPEDDSCIVEADPPYIRQALLSLLHNAAEAIDGKEGLIQVSMKKLIVNPNHSQRNVTSKTMLNPGPHVALSVIDSGPGIKPEHIHKIFDPFFSTKFTGRGLGLAATCGIVRDHQGDFEVVSKIGKGTTITLYLPLVPGGEV